MRPTLMSRAAESPRKFRARLPAHRAPALQGSVPSSSPLRPVPRTSKIEKQRSLNQPAKSACAAHDASGNVAGRRLMFEVRFFAFRKKEPLVDVMVNEIPGQNFVVGVVPRHKEIGIGKSARRTLGRDAL